MSKNRDFRAVDSDGDHPLVPAAAAAQGSGAGIVDRAVIRAGADAGTAAGTGSGADVWAGIRVEEKEEGKGQARRDWGCKDGWNLRLLNFGGALLTISKSSSPNFAPRYSTLRTCFCFKYAKISWLIRSD